MSKMIAYCGLVCSSCPTFIATRDDDDEARAKTAAMYSKKFGLEMKPEDINCEGCKSEGGVLIGYCHSCGVRKCCRERDLENCAECGDGPCQTLERFHKFSPEAKAMYEKLASG